MNIFALVGTLLFSLNTLAGTQWKTALCQELFDVRKSDATYSKNVKMLNNSLMRLDSPLSVLQSAQIFMFYCDGLGVGENPVSLAIEEISNSHVEYRTIHHVPTNKIYNHIKTWRGDTEISAIFLQGTINPIAFTGDGDCFQVITD